MNFHFQLYLLTYNGERDWHFKRALGKYIFHQLSALTYYVEDGSAFCKVFDRARKIYDFQKSTTVALWNAQKAIQLG